MTSPRIGILVVAYNAATTLRSVLERIDPAFRSRITSVLVSDDHSGDDTFEVGTRAASADLGLDITVVRQDRNLGYGGNQKFGYRWAIDHGLDIVVMVHGDGQYAPELLDAMVAPIEAGDADVVMGSRMLEPGAARRGGMPAYKLIGNRILTRFQNAASGLVLSEWHSGYRAFSVDALAGIPFEDNSDGFDFDTEVLLQLHDGGARIVEIPIPTYYGDEICYVDGLAYAKDVVADVVRYRLQRIGFGDGTLALADDDYELKPATDSSHAELVDRTDRCGPARRVLDLGCAAGYLGQSLRSAGHHVTGVDVSARTGVETRLDRFVEADLDRGLPDAVRAVGPFDVVVAGDVLEHLRDPEALLRQIHAVLAPGGTLILSVPNFGHWYPRLRVLSGRFDYDRRGILDRGHVRFFTRRSLERLLHRSGWHARARAATGLPFEVANRGGAGDLGARLRAVVGWIDRTSVARRPTLFAFQFLYELEPARRRI